MTVVGDIKTEDGVPGVPDVHVPNLEVTSFSDHADLTYNDAITSMFGEMNAQGFNKDGAIVDDKGVVLLDAATASHDDFKTLTVDKLKEKYFPVGGAGANGDETDVITEASLIEGFQLDIDNVQYTIDVNGNAIDKDGKSITKAELVTMISEQSAEGDEELSSIDQIAKIDGYVINDTEGNPVTYENTPEGIAQRTQAIVESEVAVKANEAFTNLLQSVPDLQKAHDFIKVHGSLNGYQDHVDYTTMQVDKDDKESQRQLVIRAEMLRGRDRANAEKIAKFVESDNTLFDEAVASVKFMSTGQVKDKADAEQREAEAVQAQQDYFNSVQAKTKNVIDTGAIKGFKLPLNLRIKNEDGSTTTVPRAAFTDYMFKPVNKEGHTAAQIARVTRGQDIESLIFDDLLLFLGMDMSQLELAKAEERRIKKITTRKSNNGGGRTIKFSKPKGSVIADIKTD